MDAPEDGGLDIMAIATGSKTEPSDHAPDIPIAENYIVSEAGMAGESRQPIEPDKPTEQPAELVESEDEKLNAIETTSNPKGAGAPTKYSPEIVQKLIAAIQRDFTVEEACHYAGISTSTYYNWLENYPELLDKIDYAKTYLFRISKELIVDDIVTNKDANRAAWFLTKRHADYNPKQRVEVNGTVEVNHDDDKMLEYLQAMKELALSDEEPEEAASSEGTSEAAS